MHSGYFDMGSGYGTHRKAIAIVSSPDPKPFDFVSVWITGSAVAMMLFTAEAGQLLPVADWRSKVQPLDFNFSLQIDRWTERAEIERVITNRLPGIEDSSHPIKRGLKNHSAMVVDAIQPLEGMTAYQSAIEDGWLLWAGYVGQARLIELMRRDAPDLLLMAFLQALVHRPMPEQIDGTIERVFPRSSRVDFTGWI